MCYGYELGLFFFFCVHRKNKNKIDLVPLPLLLVLCQAGEAVVSRTGKTGVGGCPKGNLGKGLHGFQGYKCVRRSLAALLQTGLGNSKNLRAREVLK